MAAGWPAGHESQRWPQLSIPRPTEEGRWKYFCLNFLLRTGLVKNELKSSQSFSTKAKKSVWRIQNVLMRIRIRIPLFKLMRIRIRLRIQILLLGGKIVFFKSSIIVFKVSQNLSCNFLSKNAVGRVRGEGYRVRDIGCGIRGEGWGSRGEEGKVMKQRWGV